MSYTADNFLQHLLKNITTYYTATYSRDTDLYTILQTYGAELASGSTALETVRNNLFIVTCEDDVLTDNFGTYFNQLKHFNQSYNDDRYTSSPITWNQSGSASHKRYSTTTYDQPLIWLSHENGETNNPWVFSFLSGLGYPRHPYAATSFSGSLVFTMFGFPPDYTTFSREYFGAFGPWRLCAYDPLANSWQALESQYDSAAGPVFLYGLSAHKPYQGRGLFGDEKLWVWDVFVTTLSPSGPSPIDIFPRIRLYEYDTDFNQTIHDSTTATTPLSYHVEDPTTDGWNATDESILFHDKIYVGWSHDDDDPHLVSYDPATDAFMDHALETHAKNAVGDPSTTFNMHRPILVFDNKILVEVDYNSPASGSGQHIYTFDGISWSTLTAPSTALASRKIVSFNNTLYAINNAGVSIYDVGADSWSTHSTFDGLSPRAMMPFRNDHLLVSVSYGTVYRLDMDLNQFVTFYQFDENIKDTPHLFTELSLNSFEPSLFTYYQDNWYSSSYSATTEYTYFWPAPNTSGIAIQNTSIPGYRKQLDFMLEAAMHGGTRKGITRTANAFTLINPDIREVYNLPQWTLKHINYDATQLSSNTWQFTGAPNFRVNEYAGAHATFTSGSVPQDKIAAAYLVMVNTNDTVTVGPIEDKRLLLPLTRPS